MSKKVLITGIGGQDGYFLAKTLLEKGSTVHGVVRSLENADGTTLRFFSSEERKSIKLHGGSVSEKGFVDEIIHTGQFDEIYHLAAQSSVARSIHHPRETIETNVLGLTNITTSIRDRSPATKLLFASSSEIFGDLENGKQNEETPRKPQSPYGPTKDFGFQLVSSYRNHYGLWAATAILFNHESEFRGEQFVTKKIIRSVARIGSGDNEKFFP